MSEEKKRFSDRVKSSFQEWILEWIADEFDYVIEDNEDVWVRIRDFNFESYIDSDAIFDKAVTLVYPAFGIKDAYKLGQLDNRIGGRYDNPFDKDYQPKERDAWQAGFDGVKPAPKSDTETPKEWNSANRKA